MVAKSAVPSNITRQEQLALWAIMALDESAPKAAILESPNLVSFNVQWQLSKTPEGQEIFVGRVVLPLDNVSAVAAGAKLWIQAQDLPLAATIPAYYAAN